MSAFTRWPRQRCRPPRRHASSAPHLAPAQGRRGWPPSTGPAAVPLFVLVAGFLAAARVARQYRADLRQVQERLQGAGSHLIETACGPIEYATFGAGLPVLVVHGILGGFDQGIASARPALGDDFYAIVPSRFGYLRTPMPADASPARQADAHAALLDTLGIQRVAVLAYSAGATSAIQLALRHSRRVAALVLSSPNAPGSAPAMPPRWALRLLFCSDVPFWALVRYCPALLHVTMGVPKGWVVSPEDAPRLREMVGLALPATPRAAGYIFDALVSNPAINSGYPFGKITAPTLVTSAQDDTLAAYANARSLAESIPGARLLTAERGGHLVLGPDGARLARDIRGFLREHPGVVAAPAAALR
jgi:pimeloyl-ACP methyl ester carboxylesterase